MGEGKHDYAIRWKPYGDRFPRALEKMRVTGKSPPGKTSGKAGKLSTQSAENVENYSAFSKYILSAGLRKATKPYIIFPYDSILVKLKSI
jgi:hypothetical protein